MACSTAARILLRVVLNSIWAESRSMPGSRSGATHYLHLQLPEGGIIASTALDGKPMVGWVRLAEPSQGSDRRDHPSLRLDAAVREDDR